MLIWIKILNTLRITNSSINPYISTTNWAIRYKFDFANPWKLRDLPILQSIIVKSLHWFCSLLLYRDESKGYIELGWASHVWVSYRKNKNIKFKCLKFLFAWGLFLGR